MYKNKKRKSKKFYEFSFLKHKLKVYLDNVIIFRFFKNLHGRFWGIASIAFMVGGLGIGFLIRPDLLQGSSAFSDLGNDVRTAPYFAGAMFFSAYGLWRWRVYLARTLKHPHPILALMLLTILGLFIVALVPVSWDSLYYVHIFGMVLIGISGGATVIFDILLSKTRKKQSAYQTRLFKLIAFGLILAGGWITLASSKLLGYMGSSLWGESMMLFGYSIWIVIKTYQGEEPRSALSRLLRKIVIID